MLARSRDTNRNVDIWANRLTGQTNLLRVVYPSSVARSPRSPYGTAKLVCEIGKNAERLGSAEASTTAYNHIGIFQPNAFTNALGSLPR